MSKSVDPTMLAVLLSACTATREYPFPTKNMAITYRARLYRARKLLVESGHPMAHEMELLSISREKERASNRPGAPVTATEWFWTIGKEDTISRNYMTEVYERLAREAGEEPYVFAGAQPIEAAKLNAGTAYADSAADAMAGFFNGGASTAAQVLATADAQAQTAAQPASPPEPASALDELYAREAAERAARLEAAQIEVIDAEQPADAAGAAGAADAAGSGAR